MFVESLGGAVGRTSDGFARAGQKSESPGKKKKKEKKETSLALGSELMVGTYVCMTFGHGTLFLKERLYCRQGSSLSLCSMFFCVRAIKQ